MPNDDDYVKRLAGSMPVDWRATLDAQAVALQAEVDALRARMDDWSARLRDAAQAPPDAGAVEDVAIEMSDAQGGIADLGSRVAALPLAVDFRTWGGRDLEATREKAAKAKEHKQAVRAARKARHAAFEEDKKAAARADKRRPLDTSLHPHGAARKSLHPKLSDKSAKRGSRK